MDPHFWHQRWRTNETGWHEQATNPLLVAHCAALNLPRGSRLFLPLCGKSLDIGWLRSQGYAVAGAELSELAVTQLFEGLGIQPSRTAVGASTRYSSPGIDIFVGNIFDLSPDRLGPVDAVYDRAALVALPPDMRPRYATHLQTLTATAPQLVICYEYDQTVLPGPPFSVPAEELHRHYDAQYSRTLLKQTDLPGGLKGKVPAKECTWLLTPRAVSPNGPTRS